MTSTAPRQRKRPTPEAAVETAESIVTVSSSIGTKGETAFEESDRRVLEVRQFVTTPANVRVSVGQTINLGNYESHRLDVVVSLPCYREEIDTALINAADTASTFLEDELKRWGLATGTK